MIAGSTCINQRIARNGREIVKTIKNEERGSQDGSPFCLTGDEITGNGGEAGHGEKPGTGAKQPKTKFGAISEGPTAEPPGTVKKKKKWEELTIS